MELSCKIQNYEWGKKGRESKVAILYQNVNKDFTIDENTPYAELWMGTHVNAPSLVKSTGEELSILIEKSPDCLGEEVVKRFNQELPFLFKVLSVNKALSIQAHPAKAHAEELHSKYPDIYKDPNHKPELAIALTPFEALCGFRPISEVRNFIKEIPELADSVGKDVIAICDNIEFVKAAFKSVLTSSREVIEKCINTLLGNFKTETESQRKAKLCELVERLHTQFPYDNGILMVYFLNYLNLQPSQAIYLGANEPHAYLSGDCIECMACSDNVVRAGLTPKFIDKETLCSMLIYKGENPSQKIFAPLQEDNFGKIFKPPVPDFAVVEIQVPVSQKSYSTTKRKSASILLAISGKGQYNDGDIVPGITLFIPANQFLEIRILEDLLMYQALANV